MNRKLIVVWLWLLSSWSSFIFAQKNVQTQSLLWVGYDVDFQMSEKWVISHSTENRQYWFPWRQHQFISVNKVVYAPTKGVELAPGITFFNLTLPQDPFSSNRDRVWEIRPHLEMNYSAEVSSKLKLQNRAMLEWRYFENEQGNFAFRNYRYRHRLQLRYRPSARWSFRVYDEFMINMGQKVVNNTFDQNRLGVAAQYHVNRSLGIELGYLNWYQQQASGNDFFNRHIMQFMVYKKFNFAKNPNN